MSKDKLQQAKDLVAFEERLANYDGIDRVVPFDEMAKIVSQDTNQSFIAMSKIPGLDKALNGFQVGELIIMSGITGEGKCFGKGTEILMFNGEIKKVEDIKIGELIMGDDSKPRKIISLARGKEMLYEINQTKGENYIVNESHILSLIKKNGEKLDISIKEYLTKSNNFKSAWKGYKNILQKKDVLVTGIKVKKLGVGNYYGFEISGNNKRFLLKDFTVVHNTSMCQTLTTNFSNEGIKSLWFSYEVTAKNFLKKFNTLPASYLPMELTANTLKWVEERIWEAKIKYGVRVIFIDHLHFLVDLARTRNPSMEIGQIVRNIKKLALKHNLIIFLIAHTTKIKFDKEPGLGSVRDSSFIEQEADTVLYIWRKQPQLKSDPQNLATIKVAKNRREGIVNWKVNLQMIKGQLLEVADEFDDIDN